VLPEPYLYVIGDMLDSITLYENPCSFRNGKELPDGFLLGES